MHEENRKRVIELHKKGLSNPIISQRLGTSTDFVTSTIRKYKKENEIEKQKQPVSCYVINSYFTKLDDLQYDPQVVVLTKEDDEY